MKYEKETTRSRITERFILASLRLADSCSEKTISQRSRNIVRMYIEGSNFEDIGKAYGFSDENARKVIYKALEALENMDADIFRQLEDCQSRVISLERELASIRHAQHMKDVEPMAKDGIRVIDCGLSPRLTYALVRQFGEQFTIQELARMTGKELKDLPRISNGSVHEIESMLIKFGYTLNYQKKKYPGKNS